MCTIITAFSLCNSSMNGIWSHTSITHTYFCNILHSRESRVEKVLYFANVIKPLKWIKERERGKKDSTLVNVTCVNLTGTSQKKHNHNQKKFLSFEHTYKHIHYHYIYMKPLNYIYITYYYTFLSLPLPHDHVIYHVTLFSLPVSILSFFGIAITIQLGK